jgi:transposase
MHERFPKPERLAAEAGAALVIHQSGKACSVVFRFACNHRLRRAVNCLAADNSRHASDWARGIYVAEQARGGDHPHSIRILARPWLRVIWRAGRTAKPTIRSFVQLRSRPLLPQD